jgi:hypothetical protein
MWILGWGGMDRIDMVQDREGSCERGNGPSDSTKCGEILE